MGFARSYLRILGAITLFFGVAYLLDPGGILTEAAGFEALTPGGLTDVRATYGGFQLGFGAFLVWAANAEGRVRMALVLVALSIGAVGLGRAVGLILDGDANPFHVSGLLTEVSITATLVGDVMLITKPSTGGTSATPSSMVPSAIRTCSDPCRNSRKFASGSFCHSDGFSKTSS